MGGAVFCILFKDRDERKKINAKFVFWLTHSESVQSPPGLESENENLKKVKAMRL